jgi:putative membrane protein insertion efficiency factor
MANPVSFMQRLLVGLIKGYRLLLSPHIGQQCRFTPSCSAYAMLAIERHGSLAGSYLAARRIVRCNPFCSGGHDEVPHNPPRLFACLGRRHS